MPEQACAFHPDRSTLVTCSNCERPICPDDMIPAPVGNQCPICAGRMREGAIGQASYRVRTAVEQTPVGRRLGRASVTNVLIGANVGVFLLLLAGGLSARALIRMGALVVVCVPGEACGLPSSEWWRLFTAMFVHIGILHIAFNMWALVAFGPLIEQRYGKARFLGLYLVSGFLGSAFSLALNGGDPDRVSMVDIVGIRAGASGAIFGILGAWIALFFRHRHLAGARAQLQSLLFLVGINLFLGFSLAGRIDNYAHLGGLAGGILVGAALEASARVPAEVRNIVAGLGYLIALVVAGALTLANTITVGA